MIDWAWAVDHLDDLAWRTLQHLVFTGIAVGAGFVISLGLAILALRRRRLRGVIVTPCGKSNSTALRTCHVFVGAAGSNSATVVLAEL